MILLKYIYHHSFGLSPQLLYSSEILPLVHPILFDIYAHLIFSGRRY